MSDVFKKDTLPIHGIVEFIDESNQLITFFVFGTRRNCTLPIDDSMPKWMLQKDAVFDAIVSFQTLIYGDWKDLHLQNIKVPESAKYAHLSEEELLQLLDKEFAKEE